VNYFCFVLFCLKMSSTETKPVAKDDEACDVEPVAIADVDTDLLTSYSKLLAENIELRTKLDKVRNETRSSSPRKSKRHSSQPKASGEKYAQCGEALLMLQQLNRRVTALRQHQADSYASLEQSLRDQENIFKVETTDLFPVPLEKTVPDVVMEELRRRAELQAEVVSLKKTISRLELVAESEKSMRMTYLETLARAEAAESDLVASGSGHTRTKRSDSLPPPIMPVSAVKSSNSSTSLNPAHSRASPSPNQRRSVLLSPPQGHALAMPQCSSGLRVSQRLAEDDSRPGHTRRASVASTTLSLRASGSTSPSPPLSRQKKPEIPLLSISSMTVSTKPPDAGARQTLLASSNPASVSNTGNPNDNSSSSSTPLANSTTSAAPENNSVGQNLSASSPAATTTPNSAPSATPVSTSTATPAKTESSTQTSSTPAAAPVDAKQDSVKSIDGQMPEKQQQQLIRQWLNEKFSIEVPEPTDDAAAFWQFFSDGVVILEVIDKVRPGMVNWFAIARPKPNGRPIQMFQRISNCNSCAQLLTVMLPALRHVDGKDICELKQNILIAIFQEMMRTLKPKK